MSNQIEIDGSNGSGGGQIIRTAVALSAITKKSCRIFNIRKKREKSGLAKQHLTGIQALSQLCNAKLEGDYLGSEEIIFSPLGENKESPEQIKIKIETAGSITLVLQALIPTVLLLSRPLKIIFEGGATDTFFSPTIDYFRYVFLNILRKMGLEIEINIIKRGYYPEGGAKAEITIHPSKPEKMNLDERGNLKKILIFSGASELLQDKKTAERQLAGTREILNKLNLPVEEKIGYYQTQCPGSQICLAAEFENTIIGVDGLGKLGKRAEDLGRETALEMLEEQKTEACLDKFLGDQILPYLALSSKKSRATVSKITGHCKTNMEVIEKFVDGKFEIKNNLISWIPKKS